MYFVIIAPLEGQGLMVNTCVLYW